MYQNKVPQIKKNHNFLQDTQYNIDDNLKFDSIIQFEPVEEKYIKQGFQFLGKIIFYPQQQGDDVTINVKLKSNNSKNYVVKPISLDIPSSQTNTSEIQIFMYNSQIALAKGDQFQVQFTFHENQQVVKKRLQIQLPNYQGDNSKLSFSQQNIRPFNSQIQFSNSHRNDTQQSDINNNYNNLYKSEVNNNYKKKNVKFQDENLNEYNNQYEQQHMNYQERQTFGHNNNDENINDQHNQQELFQSMIPTQSQLKSPQNQNTIIKQQIVNNNNDYQQSTLQQSNQQNNHKDVSFQNKLATSNNSQKQNSLIQQNANNDTFNIQNNNYNQSNLQLSPEKQQLYKSSATPKFEQGSQPQIHQENNDTKSQQSLQQQTPSLQPINSNEQFQENPIQLQNKQSSGMSIINALGQNEKKNENVNDKNKNNNNQYQQQQLPNFVKKDSVQVLENANNILDNEVDNQNNPSNNAFISEDQEFSEQLQKEEQEEEEFYQTQSKSQTINQRKSMGDLPEKNINLNQEQQQKQSLLSKIDYDKNELKILQNKNQELEKEIQELQKVRELAGDSVPNQQQQLSGNFQKISQQDSLTASATDILNDVKQQSGQGGFTIMHSILIAFLSLFFGIFFT